MRFGEGLIVRKMIVLLILLLAVGALSGCGAEDAPDVAAPNTQISTTDPDIQKEPVAEHQQLNENRSISGGPDSGLLNSKGIGFIPTGRLTAPEDSVRVGRSLVFENGEHHNILVYAYDESGRKISSGNQRPDGSVDVFETFSYNEQGQLFLHESQAEKMMYVYTYDEEGRLQAIDHYSTRYVADGDWQGQVIYFYDGDVVSERYYPNGGSTPEYYTVYSGGKILEYRYEGKYDQEWDFYEYDEQGNLKYMFSAAEGERELVYEYQYDERGVLVQVLSYFGSEHPDGSIRYFYNEMGDCVRIEISSLDWDTDEWALDIYYEFTYDTSGNLLTEKGFYGGGETFYGYYVSWTYESIT